ncbi:Cytochrome c biogenesis protein CcsA [Aureliella helgolandensis]|uniref:Cytochrome c biogenesis protein CcsA n=2 Tax=Aureliella helgolandensis TaxID=2527968 RepID=A0A518GH18_9BACT|nr:Cytochrome c biogenesis protein CcsA [Aureliella helgolandensis]
MNVATGTVSNSASRSHASSTTSAPLAILKTLGSLKITVAMFAMGILIVLFGTLAQDEMDLSQVKREFFNCWIASIPLDILFPVTLFPHELPYLGGFGFYFPGGATIGLILLINLIAAKTTRFSIQGKGGKLWAGILIAALGAALVTVVIVGGHATDGLQGKPPITYDTLWNLMKGGFVLLTLALMTYAILAKIPRLARILAGTSAVILFGVSALVLSGGESVRLDDPGLRIVWQLLQATIASSVMLAGLWLIFGKRGGNVLIHIGVGLLMVGQFVFGDRQVEQRIGLAEGTKTNLVVIEDQTEIALIDTSDSENDTVYAIPEALVRKVAGKDTVIDDPALPCKVKVLQWMRNSTLAQITDPDNNPATSGFGLQAIAVEATPVGAAIMDARNIGAAYVQLIDRETDKPIETLLLSQQMNDISQLTAAMESDQYEAVTIDGKSFEVGIRFRQSRKPYDVELVDVERINYSGTDTPRDYSSRIVITDRESGDSQEGKTWMNNPIRYKGETFYQSRYNQIPTPNGEVIETTGLQVVENAGWVIPYMSCMMVFVGMFAHFGVTFLTFSNRYARGSIPNAQTTKRGAGGLVSRLGIAAVSLGVCGLVCGYFAKPQHYSRDQLNLNIVNNLPVQHEGRIKPFDTVARNVLQTISQPIFGSVPYVKDEHGEKRQPSEWLLGVMAGQDWVRKAEVFRIYAPEVRGLFDLPPRKGYRYSYAELEPKLPTFREEIAPLRAKESDTFDFFEKKLAQLHGQINLYDLLYLSYQMPPLPDPSEAESSEQRTEFFNRIMQVAQMMQQLEDGRPPAVIPPKGELTKENLVDAKWQAVGPAVFNGLMNRMGVETSETSPALLAFDDVLTAVREDDVLAANEKLREYDKLLRSMPLASAGMDRAAAESWLNHFNPTAQGVLLYLIAILLGFASFLFRSEKIRSATFWVLVGVFVIHTIAIVARVYISGRAPVINLYSSAVFIGWACVLLGLVLETIYPIGIANLVSGFIGISTLSVARFLDTQDTLHVLQAVLDTQFWLSTHVITVTAGYAVTFLAGFIGICALVHRMATGYDAYPAGKRPKESEEFQQILYRMMYGVTCFAIFFSFIGTVLGGLWADDSWGRFWGWDPKENGAMMIVLWNALLLHARWDKQVGARGFAALAVLGNIVTAWSWFGTNQLGIGLHSYGFTSGALYTLGGFVTFNLVFVGIALLVTRSFAVAGRNANAG